MGKLPPLRVVRGRLMIGSSRAPWVSAAPLAFLALGWAALSGSGTLWAQQVTGLVAEQGSRRSQGHPGDRLIQERRDEATRNE